MTHVGALRRLETELGELLATHERARDLSDFERYADDPVGFLRDVLKADPWSKQVEIAESVRDHRQTAVRSNNSAGKDWTAARLALWWTYARQGLVLITGPTERQVREVVMAEVARAFAAAKDLPGELYASALRLGREETAGILAFTSTEASRLTGFHAPRVLVILTESQGVEDFAWEGMLSCATGPEDRIAAVGNPLAPAGRFYAVSKPGSGWNPIPISALEHPNVVQGEMVIPGGPSREWIEVMAAEFGRNSGMYRSRVLGEFPDSAEDGLFRRPWVDAAMERWSDEEWRERATAGLPYRAALDVARFGPDRTVLAIRRGPVLEEFVSWSRCDLVETVDRTLEELSERGIIQYRRRVPIVVDTVGLGAGVFDDLKRRTHPAIEFNGGQQATDHRRYSNRRAESFWTLRSLLEAGEIALPPDEDLAEELMAQRWVPTHSGTVQLIAKDEIRSTLGRSPDLADAVSMLWAPGLREPRSGPPLASSAVVSLGGATYPMPAGEQRWP